LRSNLTESDLFIFATAAFEYLLKLVGMKTVWAILKLQDFHDYLKDDEFAINLLAFFKNQILVKAEIVLKERRTIRGLIRESLEYLGHDRLHEVIAFFIFIQMNIG